MLKAQYRMHPFLLKVPNTLSYGNQIESGYRSSIQNLFISKEKPLLFIDVESEEKRYGTSFINELEALTVIQILKYLTV